MTAAVDFDKLDRGALALIAALEQRFPAFPLPKCFPNYV